MHLLGTASSEFSTLLLLLHILQGCTRNRLQHQTLCMQHCSCAQTEFSFHRKQISQAVVEPCANLVISVLQPQSVLCSGHLGLPRLPYYVCAAFATTPSPAGAAQGLWVRCEDTGLDGAGCTSATEICSRESVKGRLKSGLHISLSFCYSRVNLKKFA